MADAAGRGVVWCVVCGVWCVVCSVWCVVCGVWCVRCLFCGRGQAHLVGPGRVQLCCFPGANCEAFRARKPDLRPGWVSGPQGRFSLAEGPRRAGNSGPPWGRLWRPETSASGPDSRGPDPGPDRTRVDPSGSVPLRVKARLSGPDFAHPDPIRGDPTRPDPNGFSGADPI